MESYQKLVYSLGTSTRSREEFVRLLCCYRIELVVDVRRFPTSRFEHFKQQELEKLLSEIGIEYLYFGDRLGGYRRGGYVLFTTTAEFALGMGVLEELASRKLSAVMCAERLPWRCHRRFITSELKRRGWEVKHIIDEGRLWSQK